MNEFDENLEVETVDVEVEEQVDNTLKAAYESEEGLSDEQLDYIADIAVDSLKNILSYFGEDHFRIEEFEGDRGELYLNVCDGDLAILIGRYGYVLESLQSLLNSLVSKQIGFHYPIIVDIENYKSRRKEKIVSLALNLADKALKTRKTMRMKPMSAYERRLVHMALYDNVDVVTHSEGMDPNRFVVIIPTKRVEEK